MLLCYTACSRPRGSLSEVPRLLARGQLAAACQMARQLVDETRGDDQVKALRHWIACEDRRGGTSQPARWVEQRRAPADLIAYARGLLALTAGPEQTDRALAFLTRAQALNPRQAEYPFRAALILLADEQPERAKQLLLKACPLMRQSAACPVALAEAQYTLGDEHAARETLAIAATRKQLSTATLRRARALINEMQRHRRALPPQSAERYQQALTALKSGGPSVIALRLAQNLIADHPDRAALHTLAGLAHFQLANVAEAIAALKQALKLDPDDDLAQLTLAVLYRQRKLSDRALHHAQLALRGNPFSRAALSRVIELLRQRKPPTDQRRLSALVARLTRLKLADPAGHRSQAGGHPAP